MRTTLKIDDDILSAARDLAQAQDRTLGEVISELARRGLAPREPRRADRGFPVFDVPSDATPLTRELVERALEDFG